MNNRSLIFQSFIILFGFIFSFPNNSIAQTQIPVEIPPKLETLTAENVKTALEARVANSFGAQLEALDEEFYPASDLYDSWDTEYIKNSYKDLVVPDSFQIYVSDFVLPVKGLLRVTSPYGFRRRRYHYGTDLKVQTGDTIYSAFDGKVRIMNYQRRGYGYYLVLRHPNGLETVYGHLSKFLVNQDELVKAGQPIALGGNTGRSTGAHLHFEFRFLGNPINPGEIIDFKEWAIKDDEYVFVKAKSGSNSTATGKIGYHRIRSGDTLGAIARRYGTTVNNLCRLNNMKSTTILRIGRSIRVR